MAAVILLMIIAMIVLAWSNRFDTNIKNRRIDRWNRRMSELESEDDFDPENFEIDQSENPYVLPGKPSEARDDEGKNSEDKNPYRPTENTSRMG